MKYFVKQIGEKDCALACLKMLLAFSYKSNKFLLYPQSDLDKSYSLEDIIELGKKEGLEIYAFRFKNKEDLLKNVAFPVLIPIKSGNSLHMVLIRKVRKSKILVYDPASKPYWIDFLELEKKWNGECLEVTEIKGSLFKKKKFSFISLPYKISVPLFQILSFGFLISALLFVDENYSFVIPLCFLLAFVIFEFIYRTLLINEMKNFDRKILSSLNFSNRRDLKTRFIEMNNFKVLIIGGPIQIINAFIILICGFTILSLNSYLNILNLLLIALIVVIIRVVESRIFINSKNEISNYEAEIFKLKDDGSDTFKEKLENLYKKSYSFANFANIKKMILLFLIAVLCLIYAGFTGNISLNFVLFHIFIYYCLTENLMKLIDSIESFKEKPYYLSLYQYYSS